MDITHKCAYCPAQLATAQGLHSHIVQSKKCHVICARHKTSSVDSNLDSSKLNNQLGGDMNTMEIDTPFDSPPSGYDSNSPLYIELDPPVDNPVPLEEERVEEESGWGETHMRFKVCNCWGCGGWRQHNQRFMLYQGFPRTSWIASFCRQNMTVRLWMSLVWEKEGRGCTLGTVQNWRWVGARQVAYDFWHESNKDWFLPKVEQGQLYILRTEPIAIVSA